MKLKIAKKTRSKIKKSNQLELTFLENPKNKKNEDQNFSINNTINSISRIFLSSLIIVSFFYITPIIINFAEKSKKLLSELNLDEIRRFYKDLDKSVLKVFDVKNSMNMKKSHGGTSVFNVKSMLKKYKKEIK